MNINQRFMMGPDYYECEDFHENDFSQPYYRYKNAYGNYRGGYDRGYQGPSPYGFGPIGPMGPMGPPMPPYPMFPEKLRRRDYGGDNRNPIRNKNFKHLIKCGLQRQQLIKLPGDLINLMQPLNCGLCAQQFETYDLSKIHYLSKNHAKNIKKWLNQPSNSKRPKEPFRPREQYCELCDVEITSKDHATSHYSGKPHRSIVEGRKNSRNPILLQPHMKTRLRILIRREKKFYKKTDSEVDTKKTKVDLASVPPELYCNICQTAMSCSEQMTTHLNGKKHLNKEKQHILRFMKGEVTADGKNLTTEGDDAEEKEDCEDEEDDDEEDDVDGEEKETGTATVEAKEEGEGEGEGEGAKDDADDWGAAGGEEWKPSAEDY